VKCNQILSPIPRSACTLSRNLVRIEAKLAHEREIVPNKPFLDNPVVPAKAASDRLHPDTGSCRRPEIARSEVCHF
jgi:hypothetical protein